MTTEPPSHQTTEPLVGVGFDIACGNAAIRTDVTLDALGRTPDEVHRTLATVANAVADTVSFGIGRRNRADDAPVDHPLFGDPAWDAVPAKHRQPLLVKARQQLGTVGSSNHYDWMWCCLCPNREIEAAWCASYSPEATSAQASSHGLPE